MLKKSIFNISLVSAGNVIGSILGLILLTAAAKALPLNEFGKYALSTSLLVSISKIMDFGSNSIFVAESIINGTVVKSSDAKSKFISLKIILFVISLVVSISLLLFFKLYTVKLLFLFILGIIGYLVNYTLFPFFQKDERYHFAVGLNFLPAIIKGVFGTLILLKLIRLDLNIAFSIFSASLFSSASLFIFMRNEFKNLKVSFSGLFSDLKLIYPAGISQIINESWMAISNGVIKLSKNFSDVGIFSLANKVSNAFSLISLSIFTVLLPKNSIRKKHNLKYDLTETAILSCLILLLSLVAIASTRYLFPLIFGDKFSQSVLLIDIMILASAFTAIHTFMENYFFVENQTKLLLVVSALKLSIFLTSSALLIPIFSLRGAAYAQLISAFVTLLTTITILTKRVRLKALKI